MKTNVFKRLYLERGVTLIEVLIVVTILALISGIAMVTLFPRLKEGQIKTTKTSAFAIRQAALQWRAEHPEECPTPQRLVQDKVLDSASKITDAWDMPYKIICEDEEIIVVSFGTDKKEGTADDIRIPTAVPAKQ
ncbi:type II secretion system protein [Pajaroellobacter abortibovis]|uniref:Type II secretion system protein GspG C-terminal domain-containing protein n=1 Tax=Pajaroellobacter abortibovis TaxID=1882918 RepID=A0A1L6MWU2_9BACT|nr:type II secretion system protein [Pajaroellobacter abortibovis]APS00021.1 hypothetical protein BCY86_04465 [Pajaroellobacter abortibovis]